LIANSWFCRGQNEFMLLPVSFIVIKSIRVNDKPHSERSSYLWPTACPYGASLDSFSSGLISELNQSLSHKQMRLRCRVSFKFICESWCFWRLDLLIFVVCEQVVSVLFLILERNTIVDLQVKSNPSGPLFDIPLAGFVLGKLFMLML